MRKEVNESWILLGNLYSNQPLRSKSREDLMDEAKEKVFAHVWDKMRKYGETRPPFIDNPEKSDFIKAQGVQKIVTSDMEGHGYLLREKDHFTIMVKKDLRETKKRTVIAHELGHTFFFDEDKNPIYHYPNDFSICWPSIEGPSFEIGRQILVPKQSLPNGISSNMSIEYFYNLRNKYKVSKNIMAYRLIHDLKFWDVYMFITTYDLNNHEIMLPKNHERFKGASFKNFYLNKNWSEIRNILEESINNPERIFTKKKKIGRSKYYIESYSRTGSQVLCLIKFDKSS